MVLILGVTLPHTQAGVILSSSRLEKCTSSGNAEDLDCKRKIVVAMTVESGEVRVRVHSPLHARLEGGTAAHSAPNAPGTARRWG